MVKPRPCGIVQSYIFHGQVGMTDTLPPIPLPFEKQHHVCLTMVYLLEPLYSFCILFVVITADTKVITQYG